MPDLEGIEQFEDLVTGAPDQPSQLPDEATASARYVHIRMVGHVITTRSHVTVM